MSAVSYLRSRLEALEMKTRQIELEKQQIIQILEELEPIVPRRPLADGQTVGFKNLGSNEFMTNSGRTQKKGGKSISLASSNAHEYKFQLSEYNNDDQFIIGDGQNVLDFAHGHTIPKVVSYPVKHLGCNQRWVFEEKPNGKIIYSCRTIELKLVLVQKGDIYTCVPWDSIEGTDQEKFAYWLVSN